MTTLREISSQYVELLDLAEQGDKDLALALKDTMEAIEGEFTAKAEAMLVVMGNMMAEHGAIMAEVERLQERAKSLKGRHDSMKDWLKANMEHTNIKTIRSTLYTVTLAQGTQVAIIDDESKLPDELTSVKTSIVPDKRAILAKLKAGEVVEGARLERTQSSIRIK